MSNYPVLRPSYWASVSGGKDSLYMLNLILHNQNKYPLSGVVHFELEIDYPFIHNVIDYMESECKKYDIPFLRFKPRTSWYSFYERFGFPTRKARWCNSKYKLDAAKQLEEHMKSLGYYTVQYIGFCINETARRDVWKESKKLVRYPLIEECIDERKILEWAREQPIFNNYYKTNDRCGCMFCPMTSKINWAYLYKYYPDKYDECIALMKETEEKRKEELGRPFSVTSSNPKYNAEYLDNVVKNKWIHILNEKEKKL